MRNFWGTVSWIYTTLLFYFSWILIVESTLPENGMQNWTACMVFFMIWIYYTGYYLYYGTGDLTN